jgi:uncharacterized protein
MKQHLNSIIFAIAAIVVVVIATQTYKHRNRQNDLINVTGLGSKDFKSDLIVWRGYFNAFNTDLKASSGTLEQNRESVRKYLTGQGIAEGEIVFSAVETEKVFRYWNDDNGHQQSEFQGYRLSQNVKIESKDVEKVEQVSREVTELINQGIEISSGAPEYYYTKLAELKIQMVAAATEDARTRAEQIAKNAGADLGSLRYAQMGIFQITAQNSSEDYSWGGSFNTSSKMKTANITMKLQFGIN